MDLLPVFSLAAGIGCFAFAGYQSRQGEPEMAKVDVALGVMNVALAAIYTLSK